MNADHAHLLVARYLVDPHARARIAQSKWLDDATLSGLARFGALIARVRHNQIIGHFPETCSVLEQKGLLSQFFLHYEPTFQAERLRAPRDGAGQRAAFHRAVVAFAGELADAQSSELADWVTHEYALSEVKCRPVSRELDHSPEEVAIRWRGPVKIVRLSRQFIAEKLQLNTAQTGVQYVVYLGSFRDEGLRVATTDEDTVALLRLLLTTTSLEELISDLRFHRPEFSGEDARLTVRAFADAGFLEYTAYEDAACGLE